MSTAIQVPPVNTPLTNKQGQLDALWSRWFIRATTAVSLDCAPADARYVVTTANSSLTQESNLGALTAGHVTLTVAGGVAALHTSATIPSADLTGALPALDGSALTSLNATNLASGTVPDGRFPATLPAASAVNLTALNASALASGTVPDARFPATLPSASGVNLTALKGTNVTHQVVTKVFADSPYTVLATDWTILVNATGGAVTVTLPTPTSGRLLCVKKTDASANAVTLTGTIDGVVNPTLIAQYNSVLMQGDGTTFSALARI